MYRCSRATYQRSGNTGKQRYRRVGTGCYGKSVLMPIAILENKEYCWIWMSSKFSRGVSLEVECVFVDSMVQYHTGYEQTMRSVDSYLI